MNYESLFADKGEPTGFVLQTVPENLRRVRELACERRNRPRVSLALVPLLKHGEIGAPGLPILAALPAVARKVIGGRREPVRCAVQDVATPVAAEINGAVG